MCEKMQRTIGLLDLGSVSDAREAWCGGWEEVFGASHPGAAGQPLLQWALSGVEFPCGSRDVIRNEGCLHHWKCHRCERAASKPGYEIPMARENHTNTAERSLGGILAV